MVTIREIAKEAGVSVGTVSNVLNGYEHISQEVSQRVQEVIRKHNYHPNSNRPQPFYPARPAAWA